MKGWVRSGRGRVAMMIAGLIVALTVAAIRGQALPGDGLDCGVQDPSWTAPVPSPNEPPMVDAPTTPRQPFTPPSPTPLAPEQAVPLGSQHLQEVGPAIRDGLTVPFAPGMPFGAMETRDPPVPVVRLRVHAPARMEPGKEIEYRLTVENISRADAHHVQVRDRLPKGVEDQVRARPEFTRQTKTNNGLTDLLWDLGTLKAGEQKAIVLTLKPKGTEDIQNSAYVQFEYGQTVKTQLGKPGLQLKTTAPAQTLLYESIAFRLEITNTGDAPLRNVVVTDEVPAGLQFVSGKPEPSGDKTLTWKLGDLPPHQTRRIEYQAISQKTGSYRNRAKAEADGGISANDSTAVTVGEAKVKISVSGPQRRLAHRPIPFHITVRNLGTVPLTNVQVSDELPRVARGPSVELLSASPGGQLERGFMRWSLGTLPPGKHHSLLLVLRAPAPGFCWNEATVRAAPNLSDKARSEPTRIESSTDPVLEIDKDTDVLEIGKKASYTIRFFNPGKANILHPSVVVTVPNEMSIRGERGPSSGRRQGQIIRFDPLEILTKGEEKVYVVEVDAHKAGEATLSARWTDGRQETGTPESWDDKTVVFDPVRPTPADAPASGKDASTTRDVSRQPRPHPSAVDLLDEP